MNIIEFVLSIGVSSTTTTTAIGNKRRIINKWLFRRNLDQLDVVARKEETCFIFGRVWRAGLLVYFEKAANRWYCVFKDAGTLQFSRVIFSASRFSWFKSRIDIQFTTISEAILKKSGEHVLTFVFIFQVTHEYRQEYYHIIIKGILLKKLRNKLMRIQKKKKTLWKMHGKCMENTRIRYVNVYTRIFNYCRRCAFALKVSRRYGFNKSRLPLSRRACERRELYRRMSQSQNSDTPRLQ